MSSLENSNSTTIDAAKLVELLSRFGLTEFRPGQRDVIAAVLEGHDCLCIMPTGGGKSLCYQFPAIARSGITIVVSPLIALMKDQVDSLHRQGIKATFINSSLTAGEQNDRLNQIESGAFGLVYIAPERLRNKRFQDAIQRISVNLLAIDEAHCISEWGHDFRPDYARIGQFREQLGYPQTIALTATATPTVRQDVIKQLRLREPKIFVTGFSRPNLRFECDTPRSEVEKNGMLLDFLQETPGSGLIYAATRKRCEELNEVLHKQLSRTVDVYHGGLEPDKRRTVQDSFMRGATEIIVATNAFGMGINKTNLRFVIHYNMPGSLEAYYQEAGRAGRDGQNARCMLLFSYADRFIQEFFIENQYPPRDAISKVYEFLRKQPNDPIEMTLQEIKESLAFKISSEGVGACEKILEKAGALLRLDSNQNRATFKIDSDLPTLVDMLPRDAKSQRKVMRAIERIVGDRRGEWVTASPNRLQEETNMEREPLTRAIREVCKLQSVDYIPPFRGRAIHLLKRDVPFHKLEIDFAELDRRKRAEFEKLDRMVRYAESKRCRQWEILDYFGDLSRTNCGTCDRCSAAPPKAVPQTGVDVRTTPVVIEAVRIALSGVARGRGRFGKHLIAKMLCGSNSKKIKEVGLHKLTTFGLLSALTQVEAVEFLDALIMADLLEQIWDNPELPRIRLTQRGNDVMRGVTDLDSPLPLQPTTLAKLKKRTPIGNPVVVTDSPPVVEPVEPQTDTPSLSAPLRDMETPSVPDAPRQDSPPQDSPPPEPQMAATTRKIRVDNSVADVRPSYYWTWKLLADGYTLQECCQIRLLTLEQVTDHLLRAMDEGESVEISWLLSPPQIAALDSRIGDNGVAQLRPVLRDLPSDLVDAHLRFYLKWRKKGLSARQSSGVSQQLQ